MRGRGREGRRRSYKYHGRDGGVVSREAMTESVGPHPDLDRYPRPAYREPRRTLVTRVYAVHDEARCTLPPRPRTGIDHTYPPTHSRIHTLPMLY
jgi:hypothetical protein